jgi:hypothetical protein
MIAYSNLVIIKNTTLRADTAAHLIADLAAVLLQAGWTTRSSLTGGYKYTITSPQGYQAKVIIQDDINYIADNPTADLYAFRSMVFQFTNIAEDEFSFTHQVKANGTYTTLQVIAGICQVFISRAGHPGDAWASVAGGIPALPVATGPCIDGQAAVVVDDIWWTCGGTQFPYDFRTSANCYACSTFYRNGVVSIVADNNNVSPLAGYLCLFPLTAVNTYSSTQVPWPSVTYSAHNPLTIDAYVGWEWRIRGQLWDAFLQTAGVGVDIVGSFKDMDSKGAIFTISALSWHSSFYSTLWLAFGGPPDGHGGGGANFGNVAF